MHSQFARRKYRIKLRWGRRYPEIMFKLEGQVFVFTNTYNPISECPKGEVAMVTDDPAWPKGAPEWVCRADLEEVV